MADFKSTFEGDNWVKKLHFKLGDYMADFKSTFEGDNWVKKLHFKLGDTRVP